MKDRTTALKGMNMTSMLLRQSALGHARHDQGQFSTTRAVVAFSVSVVDGSGIEVYGEPVTATFDLGDGYQRTVTRTTGRDGRAHFAEDLAAGGGVTLTAGRESVGPVGPAPGDHLVIEA